MAKKIKKKVKKRNRKMMFRSNNQLKTLKTNKKRTIVLASHSASRRSKKASD